MAKDSGFWRQVKQRLWQWRLRWQGRPLLEPGCGACGYPVRGLPGPVCPECGAKHDEVGVVAPLGPLPIPRWLPRMAIWTILIGAFLWLADPFLLELTPRDLSNHRDFVIHPKSQLYGPLFLRRIGYGWGWMVPACIPDRPTAVVLRDDTASQFYGEIDLRYGSANHFVTRRPNGPQLAQWQETPSEKSIARWLAAMEVDVSHEEVKAEIEDILALMNVQEFVSANGPAVSAVRVVNTGGAPEIAPPQAGRAWVIAFDLAIWGLGAWIVARRRRRPAPARR